MLAILSKVSNENSSAIQESPYRIGEHTTFATHRSDDFQHVVNCPGEWRSLSELDQFVSPKYYGPTQKAKENAPKPF
jgi:hypothetical protein